MSINVIANFSAGTSKAGLTDLSVQPYAGVTPTGAPITAGIVAVGSGMYDFAGSVPDDATNGRLTSTSKGVLDSQPFYRGPIDSTSPPQDDPTEIPQPGSGGSWAVTTAPMARPVTAADLREHCRLDAANSGGPTDGQLCRFIDAAVEYAETAMSCSLMPRTITATFYDGQDIALPRGPVINVVSVTDANDNAVTSYSLSSLGYARRLSLSSAAPMPLTVVYRAGYALANDTTPAVPADIKLAILMHAATLYENRESVSDKAMTPIPHTLDAFFARKRRAVGVG